MKRLLLNAALLALLPLPLHADEPAPMPWVEVGYTDVSIMPASFPNGVATVTCRGRWVTAAIDVQVPPNTMWCAKVAE